MKKKGIIIYGLVIIVVLCAICVGIVHKNPRQMLPTHPYPLKKEVVAETLEQCGISCTIEEHSPTGNTRSFNLLDEATNSLCVGIKSSKIEEERMLGINFYSLDSEADISEEECKKVIIMGTRLFGGFKDDEQVYTKFIKNFEPEKNLLWQEKIEGIECEVEILFMPEQQRHVMLIGFTD